ncbi:MAG: hypothetical protein IT289_05725 [Oligoflexia bacterium]|nr:hypothetical protein [Oligoflexia bacterium]
MFVLTFTTDVKVRADIFVQSIYGNVEVSADNGTYAGEKLKKKSPLLEPATFETRPGGLLKVQVNSIYLGLNQNSLLDVDRSATWSMYWGEVLIKTSHGLRIKTPSADVKTDQAEFILIVEKRRTKVLVVSGEVALLDRSSSQTLRLMPGASAWIGGLLVSGRRENSSILVAPFEDVLDALAMLGPYTQEELVGKRDSFLPIWKLAVKSISEGYQKEVERDIAQLKIYQEKDFVRRTENIKEDREIKRLFRAKALGLP